MLRDVELHRQKLTLDRTEVHKASAAGNAAVFTLKKVPRSWSSGSSDKTSCKKWHFSTTCNNSETRQAHHIVIPTAAVTYWTRKSCIFFKVITNLSPAKEQISSIQQKDQRAFTLTKFLIQVEQSRKVQSLKNHTHRSCDRLFNGNLIPRWGSYAWFPQQNSQKPLSPIMNGILLLQSAPCMKFVSNADGTKTNK